MVTRGDVRGTAGSGQDETRLVAALGRRARDRTASTVRAKIKRSKAPATATTACNASPSHITGSSQSGRAWACPRARSRSTVSRTMKPPAWSSPNRSASGAKSDLASRPALGACAHLIANMRSPASAAKMHTATSASQCPWPLDVTDPWSLPPGGARKKASECPAAIPPEARPKIQNERPRGHADDITGPA